MPEAVTLAFFLLLYGLPFWVWTCMRVLLFVWPLPCHNRWGDLVPTPRPLGVIGVDDPGWISENSPRNYVERSHVWYCKTFHKDTRESRAVGHVLNVYCEQCRIGGYY